MRFDKTRVLPLAVAAAALAGLAVPAGALASGGTTVVPLTAGSLAFSTAPSAADFASTALTGTQATIHTTFPTWGVNDATGSGAGWHVTFQASQFTAPGPLTLPTSSLALTNPVITPAALNLAVAPVLEGTPPSWILDSGSAVAIIHTALSGQGQGGWTMTQANAAGGDLALTIPTTARAGTYTSTLTFTLASAP